MAEQLTIDVQATKKDFNFKFFHKKDIFEKTNF